MLTVQSPAKINLILEVIRKRDDGYHEIKSLVQAIGLYDILSFELADTFAFRCSEPSLETADNLVVKATRLLKEATGCKSNVSVVLTKRIPWVAGLGGGSSDAGTTLLALNELWGTNCAMQDLTALAARLGSDVPFFISGGLALLEGRGDKVTPLPGLPENWLVLLIPPLSGVAGKTGRLYSQLTGRNFTDEHLTSKVLNTLLSKGEIQQSTLFNTFDSIAFQAFPGLDIFWRLFEEAGAHEVHLSGSGPALFTLTKGRSDAEGLSGVLCDRGLEAYAVPTVQIRGLLKE